MILAAATWLAAMQAVSADASQPPFAASVGVDAAIRTCEAWLLKPTTWTDGIDRFPDKAGLAGAIVARPLIPEAAMPPPNWQVAPHYWYAAMGQGGVFITVSDRLPICNAIGGSAEDIQPAIEQVLTGESFGSRWIKTTDKIEGEMHTTRYVNKSDHKLWVLVSRAAGAGARRDRAQIAITAQYEGGK